MLSGQYILALLVDEVLARADKKIVVVNDATSNVVRDVAQKHDGKIVEVEVGEINVVEKMDELHAPVGGEGSRRADTWAEVGLYSQGSLWSKQEKEGIGGKAAR